MSRTILGSSPVVQELKHLISQVAATKTNILVVGESGTGKELVARMIHESGTLKDKPFIPVNCGAIAENLIESELFGHQKGSFTGAINEKMGLFEAANKGTLFLDEVGELPLSMQVKLLRAIQERTFKKVGGIQDIQVDVRIIAATNRDLEAAIKKGTFREDLFYRLNVIQIRTPPLRERTGDISLLARSFLKSFSQRSKKGIEDFEPAALAALESFPWPGNVRELENVIERSVALESEKRIQLSSLPLEIQRSIAQNQSGDPSTNTIPNGNTGYSLPPIDFKDGNLNLDSILAEVEKIYLAAALKHSGGAKYRAAELLGITFRSLRYRIRKLGLE